MRKISCIIICLLLSLIHVYAEQETDESGTTHTYHVTVMTDGDDGVCDAHCTLREAINAANSAQTMAVADASSEFTAATEDEGNLITIDAGTFQITNPILITSSTTIRGAGAGQTILDAGGLTHFYDVSMNTDGDTLIVDGITFLNGNTDPFNGGAVIFNHESNAVNYVILRNSEVFDSTTDTVGGVIFAVREYGEFRVENSTISRNIGSVLRSMVSGSGPTSSESIWLFVTDSVVSDNQATSFHGLIGASGNRNALFIDGSAFINNNTNEAYAPRTVVEVSGSQFTVQIHNSTFSGNRGAPSILDLTGSNGTLDVRNVTMLNNHPEAEEAWEINPGASGMPIRLYNSIPESSNGFEFCDDHNKGIWTGSNNILNNVGCPAPGTLINVDAMLEPVADNGGNTLTHALMTGSPAIDSGTCEFAVDQRGYLRPTTSCDIGAFENEGIGLNSPTNLNFTGDEWWSYEPIYNLAWEDNSTDESRFEIQRSADAGANWQVVGTIPANITAFTDDGLGCATYSYRVRAYRASDSMYSGFSNVVERENACTSITVTVLNDVSDGICTPVADCSLREAVALASTSGARVIQLPAGNYVLTGPIDIPGSLTIQGAGRGQTIMDLGGITHFSDIDFPIQNNASIVVEGITFQNGNTSGFNGRGVIFSQATGSDFGTLRLRNSEVLNSSGRTIFADIRQYGHYYIEHTRFHGNTSQSGVLDTSRTVMDMTAPEQNVRIYISDSVFSENDVSGTGGSILSIIPPNMLVRIERSAFVNNSDNLAQLPRPVISWGGADGWFSIENSTFSGNRGSLSRPSILDIGGSRLLLYVNHVTMINDHPDAQYAWDIGTSLAAAPALEIWDSILASTNGKEFADCPSYPMNVMGEGNILQNFGSECQWSWMWSNFEASDLPVVALAADNGGNTLTHAVYPEEQPMML